MPRKGFKTPNPARVHNASSAPSTEMDASQPETLNVEAPNDVEMSQSSQKYADAAPALEEQPALPSDLSNSNAKPKKPRGAPKAAPNADRPPGKSLLPITRVQKIMKADKELPTCAKEAVFLISIATEEFIKRLGQAGQQQAMREKRTTVQRRDIATAVRRGDEFAFLEELLSSGAPAPSAVAPLKRKPKAAVPAGDTLNIKDAFGKGKEKATSAPDAAVVDEEGQGDRAGSTYGHERNTTVPPGSNPDESQPSQSQRQGEKDDMMDVS